MTRPERPVSKETQAVIAAGLDEGAEDADRQGYPETAQNLRQKAVDYRAATGQQPTGRAAGE